MHSCKQVDSVFFGPVGFCQSLTASAKYFPTIPKVSLRIFVIERLSIQSVELYVVLRLSKSQERSTLGFLRGNNLPRILIQNNAVSQFYLGTTNADLKLCYTCIWIKIDIFRIGFYI